MGGETSARAKAWALFDRIVDRAAPGGLHSNPWSRDEEGRRRFEPDFDTLCQLLGVPLQLKANTTSGVPALALDVWLSYELRRAGFGVDQTWPRPTHPRVLPSAVSHLLSDLPAKEASHLRLRLERKGSIKGVTASSASILGKNYTKQVDVIITDWSTGPELLISTKRMDSSFAKNAPNRIEESYGDAKNLRLRHPLAALGFLFGLNSAILHEDARTAEWLFDVLIKLGKEDDAYHSTCLVLMEYGEGAALRDDGEQPASEILEQPGLEATPEDLPAEDFNVDTTVRNLPSVRIRLDATPEQLKPHRFIAALVDHVLDTAPVTMHTEARVRRAGAP